MVVAADGLDGATILDDIEPDVVVFWLSLNEFAIPVPEVPVTSLLGTAVTGAAVSTLPAHSRTYVVFAPSSPSFTEVSGLRVRNWSERPPCWSETTRIVTVRISLFIELVPVSLLTRAEE